MTCTWDVHTPDGVGGAVSMYRQGLLWGLEVPGPPWGEVGPDWVCT